MLKVKNEKHLLEILKIISEESVKKSKNILKEAKDSAQDRYMSSLSKSENMYGVSLTEQEEEADDEENKDAVPAEPEGGEESEEVLGDPEEFGSSFDSVIKNINSLRAGRSTKDKEIKEELLEYYDRLDEDERKILHLFLRELSKILRGAIDGSEALDPSDAPLYADIILGKGEDTGSEDAKMSSQSTVDPEENDAPPIKVNENQNLYEVRKKFKRLLKRY